MSEADLPSGPDGQRRSRGESAGSLPRRYRHNPGEAFAARLAQALALALLAGAIVWFLVSALQVVRGHLLAEYGSRAWLLPLAIGLFLFVLLVRLLRAARELPALGRAWRDRRNSLNDK